VTDARQSAGIADSVCPGSREGTARDSENLHKRRPAVHPRTFFLVRAQFRAQFSASRLAGTPILCCRDDRHDDPRGAARLSLAAGGPSDIGLVVGDGEQA